MDDYNFLLATSLHHVVWSTPNLCSGLLWLVTRRRDLFFFFLNRSESDQIFYSLSNSKVSLPNFALRSVHTKSSSRVATKPCMSIHVTFIWFELHSLYRISINYQIIYMLYDIFFIFWEDPPCMNLMQRGSQVWINVELVECQVANGAIN